MSSKTYTDYTDFPDVQWPVAMENVPVPIVYGYRRVKGNIVKMQGIVNQGGNIVSGDFTFALACKLTSLDYILAPGKERQTYASFILAYPSSSFYDGSVGGAVMPYSGTAGIGAGNGKIRNVATLHCYNAKVFEALYGKMSTTGTFKDVYFMVSNFPTTVLTCQHQINFGVNPVVVVYDLLTNASFGGIPAAEINTTSFNQVGNIYAANTTGCILNIDKYDTIQDIIKNIGKQFGLSLLRDADGKIKMVYEYRLSDKSRITPVLSLSDVNNDFFDFKISRESFDKTVNELKVSSINYGLDEAPEQNINVRNEGNILLTGLIRSEGITLDMFTGKYLNSLLPGTQYVYPASERAKQLLNIKSYPKATIQIETSMRGDVCSVGDFITISNADYGITNVLCRIDEKEFPQIDSNRIKFKATVWGELFFNNAGAVEPGEDQRGTPMEYIPPTDLENLTFPAGTSLSTARSVPFSDDATSQVYWGANQVVEGKLIYGVDYYVVDNNKIQLYTQYATSIIQSNSLGLLNVDTWQGT